VRERTRVKVTVNGDRREIAEGTTVAELLGELGVIPAYCAIERNRQVVPRSEFSEQVLQPDDQIEIVTLVGGG
jgi:thiamine biosynthesis protein ThiS